MVRKIRQVRLIEITITSEEGITEQIEHRRTTATLQKEKPTKKIFASVFAPKLTEADMLDIVEKLKVVVKKRAHPEMTIDHSNSQINTKENTATSAVTKSIQHWKSKARVSFKYDAEEKNIDKDKERYKFTDTNIDNDKNKHKDKHKNTDEESPSTSSSRRRWNRFR